MEFIKRLLMVGVALCLAHVASADVKNLTAETASPGGAPYATITTLGELAVENGIASLQVSDGQTLTNTLQNLGEGKTDVGAFPFVLPFLMSRGAGAYADLGAEKGQELLANVHVLYTYRFGGFALFAYDSKGIDGWNGLRDKKILNGPPRGGALTNGRTLIQIAAGLEDGKDYQGVQVNWGQMVSTITDGSVDAAVLPWYFPDSRATPSLAAGNITAWAIPMEIWETDAMQNYMKSPGVAQFVLDMDDVQKQEGLTIVTEDNIWRSPATIGGDAVSGNVDYETAKALTKAFIENIPRYEEKAPFMPYAALGELDPVITGMCGANPLKYHPAAVEAWEEAGYTVPDCAKP